MANNYSQFSEAIEDITPEEAKWIETVLGLDFNEEADLEQLKKELSLEGDHDFDMWPYFEWAIQDKKQPHLWLYCEEGLQEEHLTWFMQAFINKFRPDYVFSVTGSATCSKQRVGEFGGWWLVISKNDVVGGNTWDAARVAVEALKTGNFGPEVD